MIPEWENRRVGIAGMMVTAKEVWTKESREMMFVSFEDEEGIFETVVFPEVYNKYRFLIDTTPAVYISGVVKNDFGALGIQVDGLFRLTREGGDAVPDGSSMGKAEEPDEMSGRRNLRMGRVFTWPSPGQEEMSRGAARGL